MSKTLIILDTNIVLDIFIFNDVRSRPVREALDAGRLDWIATPHMREELSRVLAYAHILTRLAFYQLLAEDVLAHFDRHVRLTEDAIKAPVTCKDADDQCFINLAVAHGALLLSKDKAVTSLAKRLSSLGASARSSF